MVLFHDLPAIGQTETMAALLGREMERENLRQGSIIHTNPLVG